MTDITMSISASRRLTEDGFAIVAPVISPFECREIKDALTQRPLDSAGSRNLLDSDWCAALATRIRTSAALDGLLNGSVAVQCTYFDKSPAVNWLVPLHQDLSIPVKARVDCASLKVWSIKEGGCFVQAPTDVLERMVAVRLHLDDNGPDNGPLRVVPGSHRLGRLPSEAQATRRAELGEVECHAPRGGVVLMKPLLLHASSKATGPGSRRVLHYLYGPAGLPFGLEWAHAM